MDRHCGRFSPRPRSLAAAAPLRQNSRIRGQPVGVTKQKSADNCIWAWLLLFWPLCFLLWLGKPSSAGWRTELSYTFFERCVYFACCWEIFQFVPEGAVPCYAGFVAWQFGLGHQPGLLLLGLGGDVTEILSRPPAVR